MGQLEAVQLSEDEGRLHPGQVDSSSQGHIQRKTAIRTVGTLGYCGRKPQYPREPTLTGRTCKLHREKPQVLDWGHDLLPQELHEWNSVPVANVLPPHRSSAVETPQDWNQGALQHVWTFFCSSLFAPLAGGWTTGPAEETQGDGGRARQVLGGLEGCTGETGAVREEGCWREFNGGQKPKKKHLLLIYITEGHKSF